MKNGFPFHKWTCLPAVAAFAFLADTAQAVLITFDSASDLADNFLIRQLPIVGSKPEYPEPFDWSYEWTDSAGAGGTAGTVALDVDPNDNNYKANEIYTPALYYTGGTSQTFNPAPGGDPLRIGIYFQGVAAANTSASRTIVCFTDKDTENLASHNYPKIGARVFKNGTTDFTLQLLAIETSNTHPNNSVLSFGTFNLITGNWYKLSSEVARTGAKTFSVTGELLDYGADGTSDPILVSSGSAGFANNTMGGDTTWVAGTMIQNLGGGAMALDNFSVEVVPEPGVAALLVVGGLVLLIWRRASGRPSLNFHTKISTTNRSRKLAAASKNIWIRCSLEFTVWTIPNFVD